MLIVKEKPESVEGKKKTENTRGTSVARTEDMGTAMNNICRYKNPKQKKKKGSHSKKSLGFRGENLTGRDVLSEGKNQT